MPENKDDETLISHLEALRETLLKCFISMGLILPFAFFIAPKALNMLIKIIIGESSVMLNYFSPIEVFIIQIKLALVLWLSVAFGFMFQMPLITYYLIKSGIISYDSVCEKRRYVIVILLFVAAILTPPDVISQIMLFIPTYCLFEAGLFFARKYNSQDKNNS